MPHHHKANPRPDSLETGALGICHLKRFWAGRLAQRQGLPPSSDPGEWQLDRMVLDALGLGLTQVAEHLFNQAPTFGAFEQWIIDVTGGPPSERIARFNAQVRGAPTPTETQQDFDAIDAMDPVLTAADLAHWEREGFVILPDAVDEAQRSEAEQLVWNSIGGRSDDVDSWYGRDLRGITLEVYQHPALTAIRESPRIHKAFAQLWGTADLWSATDRLGFNPPIRPGHIGSVQKMHWDVSLARPVPFGTQGMLYLTHNPAEQGAFCLVPCFHRRIDAWLDALPAGAIPGQQDLPALGAVPVPGRAGDLVIWNHLLPHGPTQNHGPHPRIVLYMNCYASAYRAQAEWV